MDGCDMNQNKMPLDAKNKLFTANNTRTYFGSFFDLVKYATTEGRHNTAFCNKT